MNHKTYLRILQGGALLSLFLVLFVSKNLLFPYISSKQITYNILLEILLVFYLLFILKYPAYRPKFNLITYGLLAYLVVILISAFIGVDFNMSFWGNIERMLGFFQILHYFIFYLILITAFRSWRDWRLLLNTSILVATVVSIYGLLGPNSYSTIGNTAYVSGYLIFNLFFVIILFLREKKAWRYFYLLPILIILWQFVKMKTSGAIIGLFVGLFVALILLLIVHQKKAVKLKLTTFLLIVIAILGFVFSQQEATWFQNSFLRNLTSQKNTFQTRWLSWQGAARDFHRHPILGTGFGNFAITFDRQFNPIFFNYDSNETYFDRAHNNLIDIASTTGVLGVITYLSIFVFALIYIIQVAKRNDNLRITKLNSPSGRKNLELIVILALMVAYFVQNLAIFDSFTTYNGLIILLAFIVFIKAEDRLIEVDKEELVAINSKLNTSRELRYLILFLVLIYFVINQLNIRVFNICSGSIKAHRLVLQGEVRAGFKTFHDSLDESQFSRDARSILINLSISNPNIFLNFEPEEMETELNYVISLVAKNLSYNSQDNATLIKMAQIYEAASKLFIDDEVKSREYAELSLQYAELAIISSPGRIPSYYAKSQALILLDRIDEAKETLEYARNLNSDYNLSNCYLGMIHLSQDDIQDSATSFSACVDDKNTLNRISSNNILVNMASYFVDIEDYERAILVVKRLVAKNTNDTEMWFNLFKLFIMTEDLDSAQLIAPQVIRMKPEYKDDINLFLKQLELSLLAQQEAEESDKLDENNGNSDNFEDADNWEELNEL